MTDKNQQRAVRSRRLALAEKDKTKATLLFKIADEAERGLSCTADGTRKRATAETNNAKFPNSN
jgi:hypothetical protein